MATKSTWKTNPDDDLTEILQKLLHSGENSDLEIASCGNIFKVHSFLFCIRSKLFAAAYNGKIQEAASRRIELKGENPILVHKMIAHCYTIDFSDINYQDYSQAPEHLWVSRFHTNAEMYSLGDKYGIESLKVTAKSKFSLTVAAMEKGNGSPKTDHLYEVIPYIYASTPESDRGLRDIVVKYAQQNSVDFSAHPKFKTLIAENLDFVADVMGKRLG